MIRSSALALAALLVLSACDSRKQSNATPTFVDVDQPRADASASNEQESSERVSYGPTAAGRAIVALESAIDFRRKKLADRAGWLDWNAIASAFMARARLTGNVDDYVAAKRAIDKAFEFDKIGAAPYLTRANYHFTIHDLAKVEPDVAKFSERLTLQNDDKAAIAGLRGDVAFHSGDLDRALELYREAEELHANIGSAGRLGNYFTKTGAYDDARKWYEKGLDRAKSDKGQKAWALLHRGIVELETGNVAEAERWYRKADETFDGWYLVEEHIAEARLLQGAPDEAIEMYESILARVPNGEFMAAMADAQEARGDEASATQWRARAKEAFDRDIAKLPSAASGHALEFYLAEDRERALELARENFETRQGHEARVLLAQALLMNDEMEEAREVLEPILDSDWATPAFFATIAIAYEDVDPKRASNAADRARAVDEGAVEELRGLLSEG